MHVGYHLSSRNYLNAKILAILLDLITYATDISVSMVWISQNVNDVAFCYTYVIVLYNSSRS